MAKVKFLVNTLDKEQGITYPASNDFVEVSDTFIEKLQTYAKAYPKSDMFEFEEVKKAKKDKEDKTEE